MNQDSTIKQLAREAAARIKALTEAHQTQIALIYEEFRQQAAKIQESNGEELHSPTVASIPSPAHELGDPYDFTL